MLVITGASVDKPVDTSIVYGLHEKNSLFMKLIIIQEKEEVKNGKLKLKINSRSHNGVTSHLEKDWGMTSCWYWGGWPEINFLY